MTFLLCWKRCSDESNAGLGSLPRDLANLIARLISPSDVGAHQEQLRGRVSLQWKRLVNLSRDNAMFRFVQGCRSFRSYGMRSYPCANGLCLGISRDALLEWDPRASAGAVRREWPMGLLRRWDVGEKVVTLDFCGAIEVFESNNAEDIASLLAEFRGTRSESAEHAALLRGEQASVQK
jgi:hypothetical protein